MQAHTRKKLSGTDWLKVRGGSAVGGERRKNVGMNTGYVDHIQGKYSCILNPSVILNSSLILNPCLIGALIITHTIFGVPYCNYYSIGPQNPILITLNPKPRDVPPSKAQARANGARWSIAWGLLRSFQPRTSKTP